MFRKKEDSYRRGLDSNEVRRKRMAGGKKGKNNCIVQVGTFDWFIESEFPFQISQYVAKSKKDPEFSKLMKADVNWLKTLKSGGMEILEEKKGCEDHFKEIFKLSDYPIQLFLKKFITHIRETVDYMCKSPFYKIDKMLKDYSTVTESIIDVIVDGYSQLVKVKRKYYPLEVMREEIRTYIFYRNDQDLIRLLKAHYCNDELQLDFLRKREIFLLDRLPFTEFGKNLVLSDNPYPFEEPIQILSRINETLDIYKMLNILDNCYSSIFTNLFIALDEYNEELRITDVDLSLIIMYIILNCDVHKICAWIEYVRVFSNYFEEDKCQPPHQQEDTQSSSSSSSPKKDGKKKKKKKKKKKDQQQQQQESETSPNTNTNNHEEGSSGSNEREISTSERLENEEKQEEKENEEEEYFESLQKLESLNYFSKISKWMLNQDDYIDIRFGNDIREVVRFEESAILRRRRTTSTPSKIQLHRKSKKNKNKKKKQNENSTSKKNTKNNKKMKMNNDDDNNNNVTEEIEFFDESDGRSRLGERTKEDENETSVETQKKRIRETIEMGSERLLLSNFRKKMRKKKKRGIGSSLRRSSFGESTEAGGGGGGVIGKSISAPTSPSMIPERMMERNRNKRFTVSFGTGNSLEEMLGKNNKGRSSSSKVAGPSKAGSPIHLVGRARGKSRLGDRMRAFRDSLKIDDGFKLRQKTLLGKIEKFDREKKEEEKEEEKINNHLVQMKNESGGEKENQKMVKIIQALKQFNEELDNQEEEEENVLFPNLKMMKMPNQQSSLKKIFYGEKGGVQDVNDETIERSEIIDLCHEIIVEKVLKKKNEEIEEKNKQIAHLEEQLQEMKIEIDKWKKKISFIQI